MVAVCLVALTVGAAVMMRVRALETGSIAQGAADSAALAAAQDLRGSRALGLGSDACEVAREVVRRWEVVLVSCEQGETSVQVTVSLYGVERTSRAGTRKGRTA